MYIMTVQPHTYLHYLHGYTVSFSYINKLYITRDNRLRANKYSVATTEYGAEIFFQVKLFITDFNNKTTQHLEGTIKCRGRGNQHSHPNIVKTTHFNQNSL